MKQKLILLIILMLSITGMIRAQEFREADSVVYENEEAGIFAVFPTNYMISETINDTLHNIDVFCEFNFLKYNLTITFFEDSMVRPMLLSRISLKAFLAATGGELIKQEDYAIGQTSGTKAHIKLPQENFELQYIVFVHGFQQYQAYVLYRNELYDEKNIDKFLNSIKFL